MQDLLRWNKIHLTISDLTNDYQLFILQMKLSHYLGTGALTEQVWNQKHFPAQSTHPPPNTHTHTCIHHPPLPQHTCIPSPPTHTCIFPQHTCTPPPPPPPHTHAQNNAPFQVAFQNPEGVLFHLQAVAAPWKEISHKWITEHNAYHFNEARHTLTQL